MKSVLVLVTILALCLAAPERLRTSKDVYVKYESQFDIRIVGGDVADIADLPYQIAILQDLIVVCGGSIIATKTVLTAAHCVAPSAVSSPDQISVRAGSSKYDSGGTEIKVNDILIHEDYIDCWYCKPKYDIAAVFLADSAIGAGGVASAIPLANSIFNTGTSGVISGWGSTSELGPISPELRRADVPIYDHDDCRQIYGSTIDETAVCAGYEEGGKDSCKGDSGGPYAINGQLVGIVSWGSGCARAGFPGVYTSITGFRDWIRNNTGI